MTHFRIGLKIVPDNNGKNPFKHVRSNLHSLKPLPLVPCGDFPIWFQRREDCLLESVFAVDEYAFVFSQMLQNVGFDFVLVLLVKIAVVLASRKAPASFDDLSLAEEISAFDGSCLVGCLEDHSIAEIQHQDSRFVRSKGRNERCGGLGRRDDRCLGLTHDINAVVIAHSVFAGGDEALGLIRPKD